MPDNEKKNTFNPDNLSIDEYSRLKKEFAEVEREEKQLKDFLNTNVFDYAQNKQYVEDIFAISKSSMSFLERDKDTHKVNPNIPVVEINNLTKFYASRKTPSLLNVSLRLYLGDVHLVVGPDGSGKTTLFNCLRGIEDYEGEILIDGKELQTHPDFYDKESRLISFVPHEFGWDHYATVEDVILTRFQELNMTEVETQNYLRSSLEQMNLAYARHLNIIDLTLLEKRKVQIVVSLITDPNVIVFDEIFTGLQQHECFELLEVFNRLRQESRSVLIFSYAFDDFLKFANSITVLSEGKAYYTGLTSDLMYTRLLNYSICTDNNKKALDILKKIDNCNFDYKETIDSIFVSFDGELSLLNFQKECAEQKIIIKNLKLLEIKLDDLFPLLSKKGNSSAIKSVNLHSFFSPA